MNNTFSAIDIDEIYYNILEKLINWPDYITKPRELTTYELLNTTIEIKEPRRRIITYKHRQLSLTYLAGELAFYLSGSRSLKFISHYSKFWNKISDNGRTVNSCYGYKLFKKRTRDITQYEYAREQLYKDIDTRKAVMIIYTSENTNLHTHDNPCTMYLQFFIRDWQLILHTYMRSSDVWFGVAYDIPFFTVVQELMLIHLKIMDCEKFEKLMLGSFYLHTGSLHLYAHNLIQAEQLVKEPIGYFHCLESEMPPITAETMKYLDEFLKFEKNHRKNRECSIDLDDDFLDTLVNYLCSGDKRE